MMRPFVSQFLFENNSAKYIIHSSDIWPDHPGYVLAANNGTDEDILVPLVWAHVKAINFINNDSNKEKIVEHGLAISEWEKKSIEEYFEYTKHTIFPSTEAIKEFLQLMIEEKSVKESESVGYTDIEDFLNSFLDESYYEFVINMLRENPGWKPQIVRKPIRVGCVSSFFSNIIAYIALHEGYYREVFTNIEIVPFPNAGALMDSYEKGLINTGYIGIGDVIIAKLNKKIFISVVGGGSAEG
jgi:NitT/TauT family transport system substrate-binding protein